MARGRDRRYRRVSGRAGGGKSAISFGQAIETFVSSNVGYISVADDASLEPGAAFTISCWAYTDVNPITNRNLFYKWLSSGSSRSWLIQGSANTVRLFLSADGTATTSIVTPSINLGPGSWENWIWVYDGSGATDADKVKLYRNGSQDTSLSFSASPPTSVNDSSESLLIGNGETALAANNWDGRIDEVMWYQRALSASEALSLANRRVVSSGLVSWWRMNGNVLDSKGGNDGSVNGAGTQFIAH